MREDTSVTVALTENTICFVRAAHVNFTGHPSRLQAGDRPAGQRPREDHVAPLGRRSQVIWSLIARDRRAAHAEDDEQHLLGPTPSMHERQDLSRVSRREPAHVAHRD